MQSFWCELWRFVFIDECTVEIRNHSNKIWYRFIKNNHGKVGRKPHNQKVIKNDLLENSLLTSFNILTKVHLWAGISRRGATSVIIFDGFFTKEAFKSFAKSELIPFIRANFPYSHRVYMDNAPTHSSYLSSSFLHLNRIRFIKAPAQSPVFFKTKYLK